VANGNIGCGGSTNAFAAAAADPFGVLPSLPLASTDQDMPFATKQPAQTKKMREADGRSRESRSRPLSARDAATMEWLSSSLPADVESVSMSSLNFGGRKSSFAEYEDDSDLSKSLSYLPVPVAPLLAPKPTSSGDNAASSSVSSNTGRRSQIYRKQSGPKPAGSESRTRSWGERFRISRLPSVDGQATAAAASAQGNANASTTARVPRPNGVARRAKSTMHESTKGGTAKAAASPVLRKTKSKRGGEAAAPADVAAAIVQPQQAGVDNGRHRPTSVMEAVRQLERENDGSDDILPQQVAMRSKTLGVSHPVMSRADSFGRGSPTSQEVVQAQTSAAEVALTARTMSVDERRLNKRQVALELGLAAPEVTYDGMPVSFDAETGLPSFRGGAPWMRKAGVEHVRHPDGKVLPLSRYEQKSRRRPAQAPRAQTNIPSFHSDGAAAFRQAGKGTPSNVDPTMLSSSVTTQSQPVTTSSNGFLKSLLRRKKR
jgi:hypothetical protein